MGRQLPAAGQPALGLEASTARTLPLSVLPPAAFCPLPDPPLSYRPLHFFCNSLHAGAASVVACDLQEPLCDVARKAAAANGLSGRVSVVHRDAALLQRGKEVRPLGVNLVLADIFDAGEC